MGDTRSRIAALSPQQRTELESRIAALMAERGPVHQERIKPRDPSQPAPLGIAQQREWAIERLRAANNITGAFRVEGDLDLALLSRVLTELLERHTSLRSTVEVGPDGRPIQVVGPTTVVATPVVDLSGLPPERREEELLAHCRAGTLRPFDPTDNQRLRILLLRLAPREHVALFVTDHAASDAWSLSILVREVAALYAAFRGDAAMPPLPELQFSDFAAWQRERFTDERIAAEVRHWHQTLEGICVDWSLPADRPYPTRPTYAGDGHTVDLTTDLAASIRHFCDEENVSLFSVVLTACSLLLYRYLDQGDLVIGSLVSGRSRRETEELIGCFANPLPLRMRLSDEQTLRDVAHQARQTFATAMDHQDVPFDRLIEALRLGRQSAQTSLSPLWINVLTVPDGTLELPGLRITPEPIDLGLASVDLTLSAMPYGDTVRLQWQYMTELFDPATIAVLSDQFLAVLRQLVNSPERTVGQIEVAVARAATGQSPSLAGNQIEAGFVELFQRRVALSPHAPAVLCDTVATSYADLNRAANRLAHHLRARGVGPETRVGILVRRSPRFTAAIIGVLKAGGCYVPLDPSYPASRMAFMLADSGARVLVTERSFADTLVGIPESLPGDVVVLDDPTYLASADADHDLPDVPAPTSLAYVVYTSGSTGRPKGAMIEHRSLMAFARDVVDRLGLGGGDRFLQFASPSFDVLAEELFPTWLAGGAVAITTRAIISGGIDLGDLTEELGLTVMELPTAYWHEWARELDRHDRTLPACLRMVIIGGERVLPDRLTMWRRLGVPLVHVYGLTETTVSSTFFRLDPTDPVHDWPNLPIGVPLPCADMYVLDRRLRPVPIGGTGELYIGGISLARGYLDRAALTAQRFIADPDPDRPGQRLYRTGDLVRQRPDGNFEFISRVDTQIKIRGFRVEPVEIESVLNRHPKVSESVVVAYEPAPGDRRLVAYLVAEGADTPNATDLRQFLERELPGYMVPAAFVELETLPLNPNGKVDHARLPAPDQDGRLDGTEEYVAPQTPIQQTLADIVASVVGLNKIGIHDNFFEVGGDSILAIQVVARAQDAGIRIEPYDLFAQPTVAQLSGVVAVGPVIDAEQSDVSGPAPLTGMQWWFCRRRVADPSHWNRSMLLELATPGRPHLVRQAVEQLLRHHDGLRQRFLLAGERTRARTAPCGDVTPFEAHDLSDLDETEQDRRITELTARMQASLDLAVGPLVRFCLFTLGASRTDQLALVVHRLVADIPSITIILDDLRTALRSLAADRPPALPAKTTSWQSWARRTAKYAGSEPVLAQRAYWTDLVATTHAVLPADFTADPDDNTVETEETIHVELSAEPSEALLREGPRVLNCRPDDLLLTALSRTLSAWTGSSRHLVDIERHDRVSLFDDVDLTRTVGWFSYIHPVILADEPDSSRRATLTSVRTALRGAPDAGIGWSLLCTGTDPVPPSPAQLVFSFPWQDRPGNRDEFTIAAMSVGADVSPRGHRPYAINVDADVADGRLVIRWRFSRRLHRAQTIRMLAERHVDELRDMANEIRHPVETSPTPADFPLARLDQEQLANLLDRL